MRDSPWGARAGLLLVFAALIVKCVALVLQVLLGRQLHSNGSASQGFIDQVNGLSTVANFGLLISGLIAMVAFIAWFHRCYCNLAEIGAAVHPPIWAVLCWFAPGVNFLRPPEIMGELTNQFSPGRKPKKARWTGQMFSWWGFLLLGIASHLLLRLSSPATIRHWIFWETAALLANGLFMVSLVALWGLIQQAGVKQAGMQATAPRLRQSIAGEGAGSPHVEDETYANHARIRELHPPK